MSPSEPNSPVSFWLRPWALDARSLAVFRIALASVLLYDYGHRLTDFWGMYAGEHTIFTVEYVQRYYSWTPLVYGPFTLSGEPWSQGLAFALAILAATCLLAGFGTRIAAVLSWVCICSVQMRTPCSQSGGDDLLRLLVFWSMFLPLAERWSIDALLRQSEPRPTRRDNGEENRLLSVGTAALVMQVFLMYAVTAIYKINPIWWNGEALLSALRQDEYGTAWGEALLAWPIVPRLLTQAALVIEVVGPLLLLVPWGNAWWRLINIVLFIGLHVSIDLFLYVGLFSPVCIAAWLAFLPTEFWQWAFVQKWLVAWGLEAPSSQIQEPDGDPAAAEQPEPSLLARVWNGAGIGWQVVAAIVLVYVIWWNVDTLDGCDLARACGVEKGESVGIWIMPADVRHLGFKYWLRQFWSMFGRPGNVATWWAMKGRLADGTLVDPMRGGAPFTNSKPASNMAPFVNHRWQKIFRNMTTDEGRPFLKPVTRWYFDEWNRTHGPEQQLVSITVFRGGEWHRDDEEQVSFPFYHWPETEETGGAFAEALREMEGK